MPPRAPQAIVFGLTRFPDQEGIKTRRVDGLPHPEIGLTRFPDQEGIKTGSPRIARCDPRLTRFPDQEGIKTACRRVLRRRHRLDEIP